MRTTGKYCFVAERHGDYYRACKVRELPSGYMGYIPLSFDGIRSGATKNRFKWLYERMSEWDKHTRAYEIYPYTNAELYYFNEPKDIIDDFPEEFI